MHRSPRHVLTDCFQLNPPTEPAASQPTTTCFNWVHIHKVFKMQQWPFFIVFWLHCEWDSSTQVPKYESGISATWGGGQPGPLEVSSAATPEGPGFPTGPTPCAKRPESRPWMEQKKTWIFGLQLGIHMCTSNCKFLSSRTEAHPTSLVWCYLEPIPSCPCFQCSILGEPNSSWCCQRSMHCTSMMYRHWASPLHWLRSTLHLIYTSDTDKFLSQTRCSPGPYPFTAVLLSHSKTQGMEHVLSNSARQAFCISWGTIYNGSWLSREPASEAIWFQAG